MITRSVSAGPYAAPPAAGPSTTRDLRHASGGPDHRREHLADGVQRGDALGQPRPAGVPDARPTAPARAAPRRWRRRCAGSPSTPIAPPMTVASVQKAIAGLPSTVPRAASTPEVSRAASNRIEPGVEEPLEAVLRVPRVDCLRYRSDVDGGHRTSRMAAPLRGRCQRASGGWRCRVQAVVKTSAMLWPPKPKESLTAAVRVVRRGSWRTMSSDWTAASSSGSSRLAVAGTDLLAQRQDR